MRKLSVAVLLFAAACASTNAPEPLPPVTPPPDPRIGELQTALTELLERMDVLNERMARMEANASVPAPAAAPARSETSAPAAVAAPVEPQMPPAPASQPAMTNAKLAEDYRQAIILVGRGRHAEARRAFQEVFESDPNGDLADNALFWIGETYFSAGDFATAVKFYTRVVNDYAEENKAPDALLKIALTQERTGDLTLARKTLQRVIDTYPYSSTASTAKAELQRIRY